MPNFLPIGVRTILTKTGWSENEMAVYSALLSRGSLHLSALSHETCLGISTVQYVLKQLILKKMVQKTLMNNKPLYTVSDLASLRKWLKGYLNQFTSYENTIQKFINQYDFNPKTFLSKVRFYEGYTGIKQSYRTMLKECQNKEIYAIFSVVESVGRELQEFFSREYVPLRVRKGIFMKNIALESPSSVQYRKRDKAELRETKLISRGFFPTINVEINLYNDCIHAMSFNNDSAFALIIEDPAMVRELRTIFRVVWAQDIFVQPIKKTRKSRVR